MKNTIIAALIAVIAIGGALSAFAANRTVETTVPLIFLSTRPVDGEWDTQDEPLEIDEISTSGRFQLSEPVLVEVPVEVEVEVEEAAVASPTPRPLPEELPSECSFQEGEHMFFGPQCRSDRLALAWEWFVRAVGGGEVSPVWVGHGAFDYFASHYAEGEVPEITEDRFYRALFYERGRDIRLDRASDDMMTIVMLYTVREHGEFADWLRFYGSTAAGLDVETAFEGVFEVPLAEFYETFEEWADQQKLILTSIAFRSCSEASEHIRLRSGSVGSGQGFPDYRVPLELDEDDDGIVCEGFSVPTDDQ